MSRQEPGSPPPTIFVEANPLADRHLTGIGRYTARIALALGKRGTVRFFSADQELVVPADLSWDPDQDLARFGRRVWRSRRRPLEGIPPDSFAVFGCLRPEERRFPFEVSVLHDFTPLILPQTHSERTRGLFQGFFAKTLLSSDAALAVSHSTKADAGWLCDMPQDRIAVAHSGPSMCVQRHLHTGAVARRPSVGLAVSTLEPRKNAFFLLDWFRTTELLPRDAELWWVGPLGWLTSRTQLKPYRRDLGGRRIRFLGVVSDAELCRLYQTAGWSIYPSLYEGFGFPVLDALRHGAPVLTSQNSALAEFTVPGVWFFDPCDADTVDLSWTQLQKAQPVEIPQPLLDEHYNWDRVAQALFDLATTAPESRISAVPPAWKAA